MTSARESRPGGRSQAAQDVLDDSLILPETNQTNMFWREAAETVIHQLAVTGDVFDATDVRAAVSGEPAHQNIPGLVFSAMRRAGVIEVVSYGPSRRRSVRGAAVATWRGTLMARERRHTGGEVA